MTSKIEGQQDQPRLYFGCRYHCGWEGAKAGDEIGVFGWYEKQEWVTVRLIRKTILGWIVEPV